MAKALMITSCARFASTPARRSKKPARWAAFRLPWTDVIAAAKHLVNAHEEIDEGFLAKARKKVGNALKRAISKVKL